MLCDLRCTPLSNKKTCLNLFYLSRYCLAEAPLVTNISPYLPLCVFSPGDMLDLLKWRAHPERINDSLSKLKEIDGSEIVKVGARSDYRAQIAPALPASVALIVFWLDFTLCDLSWGVFKCSKTEKSSDFKAVTVCTNSIFSHFTPTSFSRTRWTLFLAFWMKAPRDTGWRCLTHWWVTCLRGRVILCFLFLFLAFFLVWVLSRAQKTETQH